MPAFHHNHGGGRSGGGACNGSNFELSWSSAALEWTCLFHVARLSNSIRKRAFEDHTRNVVLLQSAHVDILGWLLPHAFLPREGQTRELSVPRTVLCLWLPGPSGPVKELHAYCLAAAFA